MVTPPRILAAICWLLVPVLLGVAAYAPAGYGSAGFGAAAVFAVLGLVLVVLGRAPVAWLVVLAELGLLAAASVGLLNPLPRFLSTLAGVVVLIVSVRLASRTG